MVESLAFLNVDEEKKQDSSSDENKDGKIEEVENALDIGVVVSAAEQTMQSIDVLSQEEEKLVTLSAVEADSSQEVLPDLETKLKDDQETENVNLNSQQIKCMTECVEKCDMTFSNVVESADCKVKTCLCDENNIIISDKKEIKTINSSGSEKYNLASLFLNCLVGLSILFLTASLIMLCIIISRNKNSDLNNSQYDTLILDNSLESNQNNYKILDEKLVENELYDSRYELMTTEIEDEERISIRDF